MNRDTPYTEAQAIAAAETGEERYSWHDLITPIPLLELQMALARHGDRTQVLLPRASSRSPRRDVLQWSDLQSLWSMQKAITEGTGPAAYGWLVASVRRRPE